MKFLITTFAVLSALVVSSAAYVAWINIREERQTKKLQPLLGVVYEKQKQQR